MTPMGRPKIDNPKSKQLTVRFDNVIFKMLEESATKLGLTKVEVIRQGMKKYFRR